MKFLACMLVPFFSSTKLVLILFLVCVCCSWLFPNFSSGSSLLSFMSFLSFVVSSVASSPISFFSFVYSIRIVIPYDLYKLLIRMVHANWWFVKTIRIDYSYMDWQSIGTLWIISPYTFNTQEKKTQTTKLMATIAKRM